MEHRNFILFLLLFVGHFMFVVTLRCYMCREERCQNNADEVRECLEGTCVAVRLPLDGENNRHCMRREDAEDHCRALEKTGSGCSMCETDLCNNDLPVASNKYTPSDPMIIKCYDCAAEKCKKNKDDVFECYEGVCVAIRLKAEGGNIRKCIKKTEAKDYCKASKKVGSGCYICDTDLCNNDLPKASSTTRITLSLSVCTIAVFLILCHTLLK